MAQNGRPNPGGDTKYTNLAARLVEFGEIRPQIRKAFILKVGCLLLAEIAPPHGPLPISGRAEVYNLQEDGDAPIPDGAESILGALEKHPNVFDVVPPPAWDHWGSRGGKFGAIVEGPVFSLRVHLPKAQHKYQDMDCVEHFSVLSDGSIFGAFSPIHDAPCFANIGHEYRELARSQIEKSTKYKSPTIGPTPVHPDFYFVFLEEVEEGRGEPRIYGRDGDIFVVSDEPGSQELRVILETFLDIRTAIENFYWLQMSRNNLIDYEVETSTHFSEIADSVSSLISASSWQLWQKRKFTQLAKLSLAQIQVCLVQFESDLSSFERLRRRFLADIKKHPILRHAYDYFDEMAESEIEIPSTLGNALDFFESEFQLYRNVRSLLIASLLGGVVGALLTGLIALITAKN
jgi:hypothetical protein